MVYCQQQIPACGLFFLKAMVWHGLTCMKGLLPRSDHPGAVQPTPCGLNRYLLLGIYCFYVFLTGCVYMGWTPLATMILRAGGSAYLCTPDSSVFLEGPDKQQIPGICNAQEAAVQKLYTLTLAVHCSTSPFAGAMVDFAGPRLTALLGQALSFAGWCVLATTTPTSRYSLPAAFVLIGLGVDTSVFPHLCITRLFPGSGGLIITITSSAASASMFIPLILESFGGNDLKACWVYAFVAPGAMFFVALIFLPYKNFVAYEVQTKAVDIPRPEREIERSTSCGGTTQFPNPAANEQQHEQTQQEQQQEQCQQELQEQQQGNGQQRDQTQQEEQPTTPVQRADTASGIPIPHPDRNSRHDKDSTVVRVDICAYLSSKESTTESGICGFWTQVFSERYVLIVLYFVGVVWASSFYQQAPRRTFSTSVVSFLEVALPLSFLPCILLGKLADLWGIVRLMLVLNSCGVLMYALAMVKKEAAGYASVVFFCLYMSLFMGQVFVYVEGTFAPQHFGKLVGLASMVGGLLSLVCNLFYEMAVTGGERGLFICQLTMLSLLLAQFAVLGRLYYYFKKDPSPYRSTARYPHTDHQGVSPAAPERQQRRGEQEVSELDWALSPEVQGQPRRLSDDHHAELVTAGPRIEVLPSPMISLDHLNP